MLRNKQLVVLGAVLACLVLATVATRRPSAARRMRMRQRFGRCSQNDTCPEDTYKVHNQNMTRCLCLRPTKQALRRCELTCPMDCPTKMEFVRVTSRNRRRPRFTCTCDCEQLPEALCLTCDSECEEGEQPVYLETGCRECGTCRNMDHEEKAFFGCPTHCDLHLIRRTPDGGLICECQDEQVRFAVEETV